MGRNTRRPRRTPETPSPGNGQLRKPQSVNPVNQQEQQYVDSLSPDARQVYEIIQKAKRDLRHQPIADTIGSGFGISPKGTSQSPQDLDREFQNAIRYINNPTSSQPIVNDGSVTSGARPGNPILQRILNKRSNETHGQWYARIDPDLTHSGRRI